MMYSVRTERTSSPLEFLWEYTWSGRLGCVPDAVVFEIQLPLHSTHNFCFFHNNYEARSSCRQPTELTQILNPLFG